MKSSHVTTRHCLDSVNDLLWHHAQSFQRYSKSQRGTLLCVPTSQLKKTACLEASSLEKAFLDRLWPGLLCLYWRSHINSPTLNSLPRCCVLSGQFNWTKLISLLLHLALHGLWEEPRQVYPAFLQGCMLSLILCRNPLSAQASSAIPFYVIMLHVGSQCLLYEGCSVPSKQLHAHEATPL